MKTNKKKWNIELWANGLDKSWANIRNKEKDVLYSHYAFKRFKALLKWIKHVIHSLSTQTFELFLKLTFNKVQVSYGLRSNTTSSLRSMEGSYWRISINKRSRAVEVKQYHNACFPPPFFFSCECPENKLTVAYKLNFFFSWE